MKVVDSEQMAEIDRRARDEYAVPSLLLMENAATRMYGVLRREIWGGRLPSGPILFLVGKGNNGGDALVLARHCRLDGGRDLTVLLAAGLPADGSDPAVNLEICRRLGLEVLDRRTQASQAARRIDEAAWVLDGLFGTGLKGGVRAPFGELVEQVNRAAARVVSVDLPSGLGDEYRDGDPCIRAAYTLTVGLPKRCLYLPAGRLSCGCIRVVTGVFPPALVEDPSIAGELLETEPQEFFPDTRPGGALGSSDAERPVPLPAPLPADTYKTRRGHLAVFAGSPGTTGAAWLCSNAAMRSRAGLVTLFADREAYLAMVPGYHSVMIHPWGPEDDPRELDLSRYSGLLIGPGWGTAPDRARWLDALLASDLPGVLDADGLTLLAGRKQVSLGGRWVLTPHPGEFSRLCGLPVREVLADPVPKLLDAAARLEAVVVLKGHVTLVAEPGGRYRVLDAPNPAMATGGSGDVLAGVVAGYLASGLPAAEAAALAVLTHSRAGLAAFRENGNFISEDLLPWLSRLQVPHRFRCPRAVPPRAGT